VIRLRATLNRVPIGLRSVTIGGQRLYADSIDRLAALVSWRIGIDAKEERALIERIVQPGMVAVDVGANVGLHTLGLARRVGPSGRVIALEPDPTNFRLLARAVKKARLANVDLHRLAAADAPGTLTLYLSESNYGDHRTVRAAEARYSFPVSAVSLDDLLAGEERIDFVKVDVQGTEAAVFRGMARTLARNPGIRVLAELCPELIRLAGETTSGFFGVLRDSGLCPHRVLPTGEVEPVTEEAAIEDAERWVYINLYFKRPER